MIELAIGMMVIALLLGSILVPLSAQVEQRKVSETQRALEEIRESLVGFAIANGYLPCPDVMSGGTGTPNDGLEDVTGNNCVSADGNLPWATLGAPSADSWGNRFRYRVDATFSQRPSIITFSSVSGIEVCSDAACVGRLTNSGDGPVAVIVSHGKNGFGAMNSTTNLQNPMPAVGSDEMENADGDLRFVSRVHTGVGTTAGEFDDIVIWLPRTVLFNRMVAAGKLP